MTRRCPPAALLLLVALVSAHCGGEGPPTSGGPTAAPAAGQPLVARVVEGECMGVLAGAPIQPGAAIETAPDRRAKVELSDGSTVVLDHDTRIVLEASGRQLRFEKGQAAFLVVQVPGVEALKIRLPGNAGDVEVTGTKLAVRADGETARVNVSRGEARLASPHGTEVVRPGEQGEVEPGKSPKVAASPDLGVALGWADAGATDEDAGIGSLRARDPNDRTGAERPLRLAEHRIGVRVIGPIARTEVEQTFANDGDRRLEGTYRFPLPSGARVASMALEVDGQWREGRFVDRAVGERIWRGVIRNAQLGGRLGRVNTDDILFAPGPWRDPALLAWEAGNRFSIRIHPILPHSSRKVRLVYVQTLDSTGSGRRYVYPLPQGQWESLGRSVADRVSVDVRVTGHDTTKPVVVRGLHLASRDEGAVRVLSAEMQGLVPAGNLVVEATEPGTAAIRTATYRDGGDLFAVLAIRPELPRAATPRFVDHAILVDSSYSVVGEAWRRQVAVVRFLVREMDPKDRVTVLACDVGCRPVGDPSQVPSKDLSDAIADELSRIEPGGTSDIVRAVEEGARVLGASESGRVASIVYVGDGVATVGVRDTGRVAELVARATDRIKAHLSTIAVGTTADQRALSELARRTGGVAVGYSPGDDAPSLALRTLGRLRGATLVDPRVTFPGGATELAPEVLPAIHAGEEVWVGAKIRAGVRGDVVLAGTVDGRPFETRYPVSLDDTQSPETAFVPAIWAERRAIDLAAAGDANRETVVALGTRYGLVTPFTSLLVLDSDALAERLGLGEASRPPVFTGEAAGEDEREESQGAGASESLDAPIQPIERAASPAPATPQTEASRRRDQEAAPVGGIASGLDALAGRSSGAGGGSGAEGAAAPPPASAPARAPARAREAPAAEPAMAEAEEEAPAPADRREVEAPAQPAERRAIPPDAVDDGDGGGAALAGADEDVALPPPGARPRPAPRKVRVARLSAVRPGPSGLEGAPERVVREVADLKTKLAEEPDRRSHHRDLVVALATVGEVDEGMRAVRGWLERDALDVEAIGFLSDMLARSGEREQAIRTLASVVEVQPGDGASHERMARVYERSGRLKDACAHRVTIAALSPTNDDAAAAATQCTTAPAQPETERIFGNLVVGVSVEGGAADLDIQVVDARGRRVSWMGGRSNVRAAEVASQTGERLAVGFLPVGRYTIEVVRADSTAGPPVRGTLELRALGERRRIEFVLDGVRSAVASVTVRREARP